MITGRQRQCAVIWWNQRLDYGRGRHAADGPKRMIDNQAGCLPRYARCIAKGLARVLHEGVVVLLTSLSYEDNFRLSGRNEDLEGFRYDVHP